MLTLITGGTRSGKSRFAQQLCSNSQRVTYMATATRTDEEMSARIDRHRSDRPSHWKTHEEPINVPQAITSAAPNADIILLDCVTVWLSNLLYELREQKVSTIEDTVWARTAELIESCSTVQVVAVTNEVGGGVVPNLPVSRLFRDLQGLVNQRLASAATSVYLVTVGIPLCIKPQFRIGK